MEKKLVNYTFSVTLPLKKKERINLYKLCNLCKKNNLAAEYEPEQTFHSVIVKLPPFVFSVFTSGKVSVRGHYSIDEQELELILQEFFKKNVKKCLFKQ